jgi:hypothetical protein
MYYKTDEQLSGYKTQVALLQSSAPNKTAALNR